jgi:sigma-B regulation protein RsbU (phosphoserine phosphatase)
MKKRFRMATLLTYTLAGATGAIYITSLVSALSWLNKPFAGFLVYYPPYVGSLSLADWPGRQAGLKYLDRIVSVDGRPVQTGQDVVNAVRSKKPGTPVRYVVESGGKVHQIGVPVILFGLWDFAQTFLTTYLCGLSLCVLGFIVVLLKANISTSWVFLAFSLSLGVYLSTGFEIMTRYHLVRLHYFIGNIYPFAVLHLALIFPDRKHILTKFTALEYLPYIPALVLGVAWQIYFSVFPELLGGDSMISVILSHKFMGIVTRVFLVVSVGMFVVLVSHSTFRASTAQARQRARMILFGVGIGFLPPVLIMLASHIFKIPPIWQILPFFVILFPASVSYSIVRHNLFDADVIIRRTVGYVVVTAVVVGAYAVVSLILNILVEGYQLSESRAFPILFTLGVILVFNPLRDRLQALVDRVFFRKEYDYGAVVDKVSSAISSLLDLGQVLRHLTQTFVEEMFVDTSSVMLLNPATAEYRVYLADGERKREVEGKTFNRDGPLMKIVEARKKEITKYDVLEDPKYTSISQACADNFGSVRASLMVPLVFQDKVIGLLNLGEKKSGKAYNRQDIELLHSVAAQGAVAIENARLFQENLEKQRMEEELNIARDLQMSMLPSVCPQIIGFTLAATSIPAREVGGDFFDFIEMGEERLGLVVGDVTGKSVSGALVMSSSRSVFRMLSEEQLTVGDIMIRANKRIKKDIKSGMFVALLYAVLDGKNKILSFCSAGQTQPILFSSKKHEASFIDTVGDNFPLGILDEADYQETQIRLEPGDRVVFYTDGIVEAMNDKREIFGFERLLQAIKETKSGDSDSLMKEILDRVDKFAGGASQSDDLTVIVVSLEE